MMMTPRRAFLFLVRRENGDDLRQDQLVLQMILLMDGLLKVPALTGFGLQPIPSDRQHSRSQRTRPSWRKTHRTFRSTRIRTRPSRFLSSVLSFLLLPFCLPFFPSGGLWRMSAGHTRRSLSLARSSDGLPLRGRGAFARARRRRARSARDGVTAPRCDDARRARSRWRHDATTMDGLSLSGATVARQPRPQADDVRM